MPPKKFLGPRAATDGAPQRKARPALQKADGWTDEAWEEDCKRRDTETQSRRKRAIKQQKKKAEAEAKRKETEARIQARMQANIDGHLAVSRAGVPPQLAGSHLWASQAIISSPASFSPSSPAIFTPCTRFSPSPDYDGDHLDGFNPNLVFPHCPAPRGPPGFNPEVAYGGTHGGSPSYAVAPSLHRGPLAFHPSQVASSSHAGNLLGGMSEDTYMAELTSSGSDAAASASALFFTQEEARADAEYGLDSQELDDEEDEEEEEDPEVEEVDPATSKAKGKRKAKAKLETGPRIKWTHLEDECLTESWKEVSQDASVGAYQNSEK